MSTGKHCPVLFCCKPVESFEIKIEAGYEQIIQSIDCGMGSEKTRVGVYRNHHHIHYTLLSIGLRILISWHSDLVAHYQGWTGKFFVSPPNTWNLNIIDDLAVVTLNNGVKRTLITSFLKLSIAIFVFWKKFPEGIKVVGGSVTAI